MDNQSNQNIYSSDESGFIVTNRLLLVKLGLSLKKRPFLRTIYMFLVERTNWKTGIVYFSYRFANATLGLGQTRYKKIVEDLINLGLVKVISTNKGEPTKLMVIHYKQVIQCDKKELDKGTEPIVLNQINETRPVEETYMIEETQPITTKQSVTTLPDSEPAKFNTATSTWETAEISTDEIVKHLNEPDIEIVQPIVEPKNKTLFAPAIKTDQNKLIENESFELYERLLNYKPDYTPNYIRGIALRNNNESFNDCCTRLIEIYK